MSMFWRIGILLLVTVFLFVATGCDQEKAVAIEASSSSELFAKSLEAVDSDLMRAARARLAGDTTTLSELDFAKRCGRSAAALDGFRRVFADAGFRAVPVDSFHEGDLSAFRDVQAACWLLGLDARLSMDQSPDEAAKSAIAIVQGVNRLQDQQRAVACLVAGAILDRHVSTIVIVWSTASKDSKAKLEQSVRGLDSVEPLGYLRAVEREPELLYEAMVSQGLKEIKDDPERMKMVNPVSGSAPTPDELERFVRAFLVHRRDALKQIAADQRQAWASGDDIKLLSEKIAADGYGQSVRTMGKPLVTAWKSMQHARQTLFDLRIGVGIEAAPGLPIDNSGN